MKNTHRFFAIALLIILAIYTIAFTVSKVTTVNLFTQPAFMFSLRILKFGLFIVYFSIVSSKKFNIDTRSSKWFWVLLSVGMLCFSLMDAYIDVEKQRWERYMDATAVILPLLAIFVLSLRMIRSRWTRNVLDQSQYALLYELERGKVTGELEFYFTTEYPKAIRFSILDAHMQELEVLKNEEVKSGGHIVRFDSNRLKNGIYFYCLKSDNQRTMKRMIVSHDNLTA